MSLKNTEKDGFKAPLALAHHAVDYARADVRSLPAGENWLGRMGEEQRMRLKGSGRRLMALLMQYNGRAEGGEVFLEEGKRLAGEYSQACLQSGLTLIDTVKVFLFFRRSILAAIQETGYLGGCEDEEGQRLFRRTNDFLDQVMLDLMASYTDAQAKISDGGNF